MRIIGWITLLIALASPFAQGQGTVRGSVSDQGKRLEFATVYLTPGGDSTKIVTGAVTDSTGAFVFEHVSFGEYLLHVKLLGYLNSRIPVTLGADTPVAVLNDIPLVVDAHLLDAVQVTATKELIQKTEQGFVVNATSNLTQIGGTAADLLKNMPGVLVSADGEVTLRGRTPLTLINGRVSGIAGIDRAAQLDRIPASSIDRIEIINNPSAKYDADSEGGVINIILKKSDAAGTNGAAAVGAGKGDHYRLNLSGLINHQSGKWNFGGAYDNWYTTRTRGVNGDRINYYVPDTYYLTQRRHDERLVFYQNAKATVDFTPNKKSAFNFELLWAFPGEDNHETLKNTYETEQRVFTGSNQRHSNEIRRTNTFEGALKYTRRYDHPDKLLTVTVSDAYSKNIEDTDITTATLTQNGEPVDTSSVQRTHVYERTNLLNASLDFAQPLTDHGLMEAGYKGIARYLNSDYERATLINGSYEADPANTNVYTFNEQIHALYGQFTGWVGDRDEPRIKYNVGMRAEQVWNTGTTVDLSTDITNRYFNLFPSGSIAFYFNNQDYLRASYSRRIQRPGLGQLNPFVDITDSLNQHSGNPHLKPELIHSWELGYTQNIAKGSISWVGFYRLRSNAILPYTTLDSNGVALTRPENFGTATTYGAEAIGSYQATGAYNFNISLSAFQTNIEDTGEGTDVNKSLFSWYAKWVNNFTLGKNGRLQITANYTAPTAVPQGTTKAVYFIDIGYIHKIMKGRGRVGMVITDLFNTQRTGSITSDSNFYFTRTSKQDTRALLFTFGYTFGTSFKEKLMENRFKND